MLEGLDFGLIKKTFRSYLDTTYDHRLLLNMDDPWAQDLDPNQEYGSSLQPKLLPGLQKFVGDPTTERIAGIIGPWAQHTFPMCTSFQVVVWETAVNCATWKDAYA